MPWESHGAVLTRPSPRGECTARHRASLESGPAANVHAQLLEFCRASSDDAAAAGLDMRRAILGEEYVARKQASTTELTAAFQDLITRYAGERSGRGRDSIRTRKTPARFATTAALGRWEEFRLALRRRDGPRSGMGRCRRGPAADRGLRRCADREPGFIIAAEERERRRLSANL